MIEMNYLPTMCKLCKNLANCGKSKREKMLESCILCFKPHEMSRDQ